MNNDIKTLTKDKDSINKLVDIVAEMLRNEAECNKQELQRLIKEV